MKAWSSVPIAIGPYLNRVHARSSAPGAPLASRLLVALVAAVATAMGGCTSSTLTSGDPAPAKCQLSVKNASESIAAGGGTTTLSVTAQPECAWKAAASVNWIADVKPDSGQGSAQVEVRIAPNADPTPRRGTIQISGVDVQITQEAAPCVFVASPLSRAIGASGGVTTVSVATNSACSWTATSDVPWITIPSGASGSGNGVATLNVAANTGAARVGTVTIGGQLISITQNAVTCSYTLAPDALNVPATGGSGSTLVTAATVSTACTWTSASNVPWITVTSGASGGSGTGSGQVSFTVAPNADVSERTGTLTIAGHTFTVVQAGAACSYTLSGTNQTVAATAGTGTTITVTTSAACSWTAVSNASWMTISSGAGASGNGTVSFTFTANTGALRSGTLIIAGQTYTVTQSAGAAPCNYAILPASESIGASGGAGSPIAVTTASTCAWTASSNATWITVNTGASGTGNGTVTYSVSANPGTARTGTITIAGQTFTVTQAAACTYSINPTSQSVGASGGTGTAIAVTAGAGCAWAAVSNDAWITVTGGATGTGNGTVNFSVAVNAGAARTGTMTIAGQTFTVSQALACTYQINPTSQSFTASGGTGTTVSVTATASCSWTAVSNDAWITVTSGSPGSGNGTVTFTVAPNTSGTDRTGTMTIATQTFTVSQSVN